MDVRILGPLEVWDGTEMVPLGGAKQRAVLAVLAINRNEVVSTDRLVDSVWGSSPPRSAPSALQVYVSQLRKLLGANADALETRPPGYVLRLGPGELDLERFLSLVERGRDALRGGDPRRASNELGKALALVRGPALADFTYESFAEAEIERLEELRVGALEDLVEADLACGRHRELSAELESLVARHPLRERLRGQLMVALYRSDRQAESLATMRDVRTRLADELGIDPGPGLQRLERAILEQDPALDLSPLVSSGASPQREAPTDPVLEAGRAVRKTVTVLACDIDVANSDGAVMDPETIRDLQARALEPIRITIGRYGASAVRAGRSLVAVFGIPRLHDDDAVRAIRAAAAARRTLADLSAAFDRQRGLELELRIGLQTGEVLTEADEPAGGDVSARATHLAERALPGEVLLDEATARTAGDAVETEPAGPFELPGERVPVDVRRFVRVRAVADDVRRRPGAAMVGRERQLDALRRAFDSVAADSSCELFTVLGTAGVGKSRLVDEFVAGLGSASPSVSVLRGRCLSYGEGITYFPVVEVIRQAAGLSEFDPPETVETKVCSVLQSDEHQEVVCSRVLQLMGAGSPATGDETFWAIQRYLEAAAAGGPLVVVFDDIHWAEPTFLDLIEHIADWSRGSPILIVCMARPDLLEGRPTWAGGKANAVTQSLQPLDDSEAGSLVGSLLDSSQLPESIVDRIVETAGGNPLFVEETVAMLVDAGAISREGERWTAVGDLANIDVPASIQALLAARLDRLPPGERAVIEVAAAAGQLTSVEEIRELVGTEDNVDVPAAIMSLVRTELLFRERAPQPAEQLRFRHILVRDAAYAATPKARRAVLHERAASRLERVAGQAVAEVDEIVGYHLAQAHAYRRELDPSDPALAPIAERAVARLTPAARRAAARGDFVAASVLLRRAIDVGCGGARAVVLMELGEALAGIGDAQSSLAVFEEAVVAAVEASDSALEWRSRIGRTKALILVDPRSRSYRQQLDELKAAERAFEELRDEAGLAIVWTYRANLEWMRCRYDLAGEAAGPALEHARRSGDPRLVADAILMLVGAEDLGETRPEDGMATIDRLHEDITSSRSLEALALGARGQYHAMRGEFEEGRRLIGLARDIVERLGLGFLTGAYYEFLSELEQWAGRFEESEAALRQEYAILQALGDEAHVSTIAGKLALVLCELGRIDEAETSALESMERGAEDDLASQTLGRSAFAMVRASRGDLEEAERLARESVEMLAEARTPNMAGDLWMVLAKVLVHAGKRVDAVEAAERALALFQQKGNEPASTSTRAFLESC